MDSLLFPALALRGVTLRNRTVVSPMCRYSAHDGLANDWHFVHLGQFAMGGFGLVFTEATAVLPGLPAFALLIAYGPLAGAAPRPLDRAATLGFVAAVVLAFAFVGVLVTQHGRIDREYAQRTLVRTFDAQRSDPAQRLVYLGDAPVSAAFYSQGKARQVQHESMLAPYFADAPIDHFAIRADEVRLLAPIDRERLALVDSYGKFELYREIPRGAGGVAPPAH